MDIVITTTPRNVYIDIVCIDMMTIIRELPKMSTSLLKLPVIMGKWNLAYMHSSRSNFMSTSDIQDTLTESSTPSRR